MLDRLLHPLLGPWRSMAAMRRTRREALLMHLGHDKVIGWEDGSPIHSLFIPGEHSLAMIRSRARMFNMVRFGRTVPIVGAFGVTAECECRCSHCSDWDHDGRGLDTATWKQAISDSLALGVYLAIFTGGEPLLRPDLEELIAHVDPGWAVPVMFTNGLHLAARAAALRRAGLRRVLVSFDHADPARHDGNRGVAGIFARAAEGVATCRAQGMLTGISTFADPGRLEDGTLDGLLALARRLQVNEVVLFDAMPIGRWRGRSAVPALGDPYYGRLKAWVDQRQRQERVGIWSYNQIRSLASCGCSAGSTTFKIGWDGEVLPCDFCHHGVGNITREPLETLWNRLSAAARQSNAGGSGCRVLRGAATPAPAEAAACACASP